jgi:serine/threonine protein kinase/formylglycine-generating enzyme required for sulfatase activity
MLARNTILQSRYRIIRPLGKGGMGQVYEAIDDTIDSIVAIKQTFANTDKLRRAFEHEAKLLGNLKHPVLPRVTDQFLQGNGQFLVMEFVEGLNLAQLLELRGLPFRYETVLTWADKLLDALAYLHRQREPVIHRDIKPANIKVTNEGEVYLLDFGLAKGAPGQETSSVYGYTAAYAPLEQLNNSGTTAQSDLYSLGATLYHLLTAHLSASAAKRNETIDEEGRDPLIPAHQSNREVPETLSAIISQAMAMRRKDRFASASEMKEVLREATLMIEREREQKILDTPTLPIPKPIVIPGPTEPAPDPGPQPMRRAQNLIREDVYLKTIPAPRPVVPPPPNDLGQQSWPSQVDSEPSSETANRLRAEAERQHREARERQQREEEETKRRQAAEEATRQAAEEAKRLAEEERLRKEAEVRRLAEEEAVRAAEAERQRREAEERQQREEEETKRRQAAEEAARRAAEEAKRLAEEERLRKEAEARRLAEEESRKRAEQEAARQAEEAKKLSEEQRRREEGERQRAAEAERRRREDEHKAEERRRQTEAIEIKERQKAAGAAPKATSFTRESATEKKLLQRVALFVGGILAVVIGLVAVALMVWRPWAAQPPNPSGTTQSGQPAQTTKEAGDAATSNPAAPAGMVHISGGEFMMGRKDGDEYERPEHKVPVKPFFIDTYEVTREDYKKCVDERQCPQPQGWTNGIYPEGTGREPVTGVDWDAANAYAKWAHKRLPTEEEWEFAARGGVKEYLYPWGNDWRAGLANADNAAEKLVDVDKCKDESPFHAFCMVGNAWEWTASDLRAYPGGQLSKQPKVDTKVIRGGSYAENQNQATTTYRGFLPARGGKSYDKTGFRCVTSVVALPQ